MLRPIFLSLIFLSILSPALAAEPIVVNLWLGKPPGETKELPPEADVNKPTDALVGGKKIIKLTNVSTPQLAIYLPPKEKANGTAVIICPGGGHYVLAYDHEGTEVAEWLTTIGVTGIVLKYRVPARAENPHRWTAAVQDAQRALSLVRSRSDEWGIDMQRIGILGFSAGGETAGLAAILDKRQYETKDAHDIAHCRPNFAVLIYPGGFTTKEKPNELRDYVKVTADTPPLCLVHAKDDPVPFANSQLLADACQKAKIPCELLLYDDGGHGYGIRKTGHKVNEWPQRVSAWMEKSGWLKK